MTAQRQPATVTVASPAHAGPTPDEASASGSRRARAARGTLINGAFLLGVNSLNLARGFIVAAFLTRGDYGVWGALTALLGTMIWLKDVGIQDRYVQQNEGDDELAFQKAFTIELIASCAFAVLMVAASPLLAFVLGHRSVLVPGAMLSLTIPAIALQAPVWVFYRRLEYARQRTLQALEPIAAFVATVVLAVAGLGYWSLVVGTIVGAWGGALLAVWRSPYRLRLAFDRETLRDYVSFSWPILAGQLAGVVIAQGSVIAGNAAVGLAGVGAIALASSVTGYVGQVDVILTDTLYPAVCRIRDRADILFESFVKSNRLALLWGVPFGIGLALFTPALVDFGIGRHWRAAEGVIEVFAIVAALYQIGFNWTVYFRAAGLTRPLAVVGALTAITFVVVAVPLLLAFHLPGIELGLVIMALVQMGLRVHYLKRLFPQFRVLRHSARALAPTLPGTVLVLLVRLAAPGGGAALAVAEFALFVAATALATAYFERDLLREVVGYLRGRGFVERRLAVPSSAVA